MKFRLNYWQAGLLCLPFISGMLLLEVPNMTFAGWITASAIANLLMVFGICITVCYQTYLALAFNNQSPRKSNVFKINTLIPAVFLVVYLLFIIYSLCTRSATRANEYYNGPVKLTNYNWHGWVIMALMIHAMVTFLFVNNRYVTTTIKQLSQQAEQQQLMQDFLTPMRILIKTCLWVYVGAMALILVGDIAKEIFRY